MPNTIYLYLKTHNITGLKYLGKTESKDPYSYPGSGTYWLRHLAKHGYNCTTEILFQTSDKEHFKQVALEHSLNLNVVDSEEFANLVHECGDGGCNNLNRKLSEEWKSNIGAAVSRTKNNQTWKETVGAAACEKDKATKNDPEWREKIGIPSWEISSKKQSETKLSQSWINAHKMKCEHCDCEVDTANYKRWHGENCSKVKPREPIEIKEYVTCPHCMKEGKHGSAMKRWHFDNCKGLRHK